jgi:hypothetical protein
LFDGDNRNCRTSLEGPVHRAFHPTACALVEKSEFLSLDDELRQWKLARRRNFEIPWRPLSLMATLCFGIASFVLPDSVNDNVQWLLYALAAASLYAGFRKRRQHTKS